jgi:SAM-dependent methyltransferase
MRMPQYQKVYVMSRQSGRRRKVRHRNAARIIIPSRVVLRDADERRLSWRQMEIQEAVDLLREAVGDSTGTWADLGAGTGTFTLALAELLGGGSTIYAVDADANAVHALGELPAVGETRIVSVKGDFTRPLELPGLGAGGTPLDGLLMANALHFVRDATGVLSQLVQRVRRGGRVIVVEYDQRRAGRWVPHPIPAASWPTLAAAAGLVDTAITATRPSMYSGILYVGAATRP